MSGHPVGPLEALAAVVLVIALIAGGSWLDRKFPQVLYGIVVIWSLAACAFGVHHLLTTGNYWPLYVLLVLGGLVNAVVWAGHLRAVRKR